MSDDKVIVVLYLHKKRQKIDLELPLDITVNELIAGLNQAYNLGINQEDINQNYLKTENPIALIKGNKTLRECGMRNATVINITGGNA
jgi:uncharacterized ubiquitin-like protein YukD